MGPDKLNLLAGYGTTSHAVSICFHISHDANVACIIIGTPVSFFEKGRLLGDLLAKC